MSEASNIIRLSQTCSTNTEAKSLASEGAREWTIVVADSQTSGRGRLGRSWHSDGPWGLWMSVLLRPSGLLPEKVPFLGIMAAVAAARSIKALCGIDASIKWPNDVEAKGYKVCGILPEAGFGRDGLEWVVLGIGMNLNEPPNPMPEEIRARASSLERLSGKSTDRETMLARLSSELRILYELYPKDLRGAILSEAGSLSALDGRIVEVIAPDGSYEVKAVGMDECGALTVEFADGSRRRLLSGEVSIRRS